MQSLETELARITDVIKKTKLTPSRMIAYDARDELDKIDREVLLNLAEILVASKNVDSLLSKKQRIIQKSILLTNRMLTEV